MRRPADVGHEGMRVLTEANSGCKGQIVAEESDMVFQVAGAEIVIMRD